MQDTIVLHIEILLDFAYEEIASMKLNEIQFLNLFQ